MSDDDDNFWAEYLADRHQLSSQLYGEHLQQQRKRNRCPAADCKGRCDCKDHRG